MALVVLQNLHASGLVMNSPVEPVTRMMKALGQDQMTLLLRHQAAQETRNLYYLWEQVQVVLGLALGACLYFATQKRMFSLVLCGVMLSLVMFQFWAITPELGYRGREMDFPTGGGDVSSGMVRVLLLYQVLVVTEGLKLIIGGVLASYLFVLRTSRKRTGNNRRQIDLVDDADHSHIDR
jgi:hypothetical protein